MTEVSASSEADPMADAVRNDIHTLLHIKTRLPFLLALSKELDRIGTGKPIRNDIVVRVVNDSFDLTVIDMASLREGMTKGNCSTINLLAQHVGRLRRFTPEDCATHLQVLGNPSSAEREAIDVHVRKMMAEGMNRSFDRLFPGGEPVNEEHIKDLITRFRRVTEATDEDRNRVRAHRYEHAFDASYRQDLAEVEQQLGVFEEYLGDLYLVLTKAAYIFHPPTRADVRRTASDMADLIVLGSINRATLEYGVVGTNPLERERLYYRKREEFYQRSGSEEGSSDAKQP